jgi:CHAT domain-containing protein/Tfp pilus assembly protein PilF
MSRLPGTIGVLVLLAGLAGGQEFPRPTEQRVKALDQLVERCLQARALQAARKANGEPYFLVKDPAKLKATLASNRDLITPALRDTLVAGWTVMGDEEVPFLVALLEGFGEEKKDDRARAFAALFKAKAEQGRLHYPEALRAFRDAVRHFTAAGEGKWQGASLNQLGILQLELSQHAEALESFRQALALTEKLYGKEHPQVAACLHNIGSALGDQGKHADALKQLDRARAILEKTEKEGPGLAAVLNSLAHVHHLLADYDRAVAACERGLAIRRKVFGPKHPEVAKNLDNLGDIHAERGDYARALECYREARAIFQEKRGEGHPDTAINLSALGQVFPALGDYDRALDYQQQAYRVLAKVYGPEDAQVASALARIGEVHARQGEYARALDYYRRALAIREKVFGKVHRAVAASHNRVGWAYSHLGETDKALAEYQKALALFERVYGPRHPEVAASLNNLAALYSRRDEPGRALDHFRKALNLLQTIRGPESPDVAQVLENIGYIQATQGDAEGALAHLRKALPIWQKAYGGQHPEVALHWHNQGVIQYQEGQLGPALGSFEEALGALLRVPVKRQARPVTITPDKIRLVPLAPAVLSWRGRILEEGLGPKPAVEELRQCAETYGAAAEVLGRMRRQVLQTEESKLLQGEHAFEVFPRFLGVCQRLHDTGQDPNALRAALDMAERGTAQVFLEALGRSRAQTLSGIPPDLRDREAELLARLQRLEERLTEEQGRPLEQRDTNRIASLWDEREKTEASFQQFLGRLEQDHPRYVELNYPAPPSLEEARSCLGPGEVALLYVLGERASFLLLVEGKEAKGPGLALYRLDPAAAIADTVAVLADRETLLAPAKVRALAPEAYRLLLGPAADRLRGKDLVIVPGGVLALLPFELLIEEVDAQGKEHYLVERHRIRYAPSLKVLSLVRQWQRQRRQPERALWALGDPVYDPADDRMPPGTRLAAPSAAALAEYRRAAPGPGGEALLPRLKSSAAEVEAIRRILGADPADVRTGPVASETAVKEASASGELGRARYVHLAAHGILGLDAGLQPGLVLSLVGDGKEDGFLRLDEVTRLKLNADLVVLSACQSGQGRLYNGEGVRGLARAFLHAGSRGVVCSLWPVEDEQTAAFMADLYRALRAGQRPADALQAVQRARIQAGEVPFRWAPFILIGE